MKGLAQDILTLLFKKSKNVGIVNFSHKTNDRTIPVLCVIEKMADGTEKVLPIAAILDPAAMNDYAITSPDLNRSILAELQTLNQKELTFKDFN